MKKAVWTFLLLVCTIILSAATSHRFSWVFLLYDGDGDEFDFRNYYQTMLYPGTSPADDKLWWFSANDGNGIITEWEFPSYFDARDHNDDYMLSDEKEVTGQLEKTGNP